MRVENVHERLLPASPERAGALLERLASDDDPLWPRDRWPRMRLDRGLAVGSRGGHGPIRYAVEAHETGRLVRFRFEGPRGFDGTHTLDVRPAGSGTPDGVWCVLRHAIEMRTRGSARLSWPLVFRPLHDALIEDALDNAERAVGAMPAPRAWSRRVRLLRRLLS